PRRTTRATSRNLRKGSRPTGAWRSCSGAKGRGSRAARCARRMRGWRSPWRPAPTPSTWPRPWPSPCTRRAHASIPSMHATDTLARLAVEPITDGMLVGLGTGRAATRGIHALAQRVNEGGLRVRCVATSESSEALARELGLQVLPFSEVERVDYLFDG